MSTRQVAGPSLRNTTVGHEPTIAPTEDDRVRVFVRTLVLRSLAVIATLHDLAHGKGWGDVGWRDRGCRRRRLMRSGGGDARVRR